MKTRADTDKMVINTTPKIKERKSSFSARTEGRQTLSSAFCLTGSAHLLNCADLGEQANQQEPYCLVGVSLTGLRKQAKSMHLCSGSHLNTLAARQPSRLLGTGHSPTITSLDGALFGCEWHCLTCVMK